MTWAKLASLWTRSETCGLGNRTVNGDGRWIRGPRKRPGAAAGPISEGESTIGGCLDLAAASTVFPTAGGSHRSTSPGNHGQKVLSGKRSRVSRVDRWMNRVGDRAAIAPIVPHVLNAGTAALRRSRGDGVS